MFAHYPLTLLQERQDMQLKNLKTLAPVAHAKLRVPIEEPPALAVFPQDT